MASRSVVAAFVLIAASCGGDGTATTTTTSAASATTTTTTGGATDGTWSRVADDTGGLGGPGSQEAQDLVVGPAGVFAVGSDRTADHPDGAVWTLSDDGTWSRVPDPSGVFTSASLRTIVVGGPGLVAAGFDNSGDGNTEAVVFVSEDGSTWQRVSDPSGEFGGTNTQSISQVIAGGPGLVAVGSDWSNGDSDAAVWVSSDGSSWHRVDDPGLTLPGHQTILGVITTAEGMVGVGSDDSSGDLDAAVWTSADGLTWTRVDQESFGGTGLQRMVAISSAGGSGLVAVGAAQAEDPDEGLDAAFWLSEDGLSWGRVTAPSFGGGGDQAIQAVVVSGSTVIAVGQEFFADTGDFDAAVWESSDGGVTWARATDSVFAGADWQIIQAIAIVDGYFVATGLAGSEEDADAAVWMRAEN